MARYTGPKHKLSRRVGECIWGRGTRSVENRNYPPGQHGKNSRRKLSVYGTQLLEKQKMRMYYGGIMERQMRRIFDNARRQGGNTGINLMVLLESRLDTVVWRLGFANTIFAARQLVNHCHILVDGKKVNIPSFLVKAGMIISIRERSRKIPMIYDGVHYPPHEIPEYLERDAKSYEGKMVATPNVPFPVEFDTTSVIGFYSR